MMLVSVSILIDESKYADRSPNDERFTASVVSDLLDGLERDTDGLKVIGSQRVDDAYVAAWRTALTYIGGDRYPGAARATLPYSDRACGMCKNALTVGEARENGRYCDVCARERQYLMSGIQYLDDGTGSLVDPGSASIIELSGVCCDERGEFVTVKRIHVNAPARGKGVASVLLDAACGDADSGGVTMYLEVAAREGAGGLDDEQLRAWYERHGFVLDADDPRNGQGRARFMVRQPVG